MGVPIPIIPNEIITEILTHLGKNDLLKCRLVSKSWNGLSLKILRNPKYGHEHELTQDNIQEFLEFFNERKEEWVLPFHLNFGTRGLYGMFKFYSQIPNYIQQLQSIFGEKCVGGLTLIHMSSSSLEKLEYVEKLISILTLVAPSLTHLDFSEFKLCYKAEQEKMKVKEVLGKTQLNFPNLSKLKSCPSPSIQGRREKAENEIHSFLIAKSKNLKELEVISLSDLLVIQKQIGSLKKLKIVNQFALEGLDIDTFLDPIRTSPNPPVLNDLSLICSTTPLGDQILIEFLSLFSTSLQSLTVTFLKDPTNPFPRLSHLKFLGIHAFAPTSVRIPVNLEKLNLNSETFPVLESMDIPTNVHFESTDGNSRNSTDDLSLGTVKNLRIRVTGFPFDQIDSQVEDVEIISRASAKNYVDHLQKLFPNVTSLTLVVVNDCGRHDEYLNQLLIALIQSDGAPKIQELEVEDCEENYLGHILNGLDSECQPRIVIENMRLDEEFHKSLKKFFEGFSGRSQLSVDNQLEFRDGVESRVITCKAPTPIHLRMTGLEKIKIHTCFSTEFNEGSEQLGIERKSNKKDLFLMSLPKHLPLLRQIDISQRMFGQDKEFCKEQIVNVEEKFPNLIINTTD